MITNNLMRYLQEDVGSLKRRLRELEKVFNSIPDLIFIQDKDHTIIKVNDAFAKFLKARPEDLVGKKCYKLMHNSDKPWFDCPLEKTRLDKEAHSAEVEDPNVGISLLVTTSPIFDDKGDLIAAVHVAKDVTQMKKIGKSNAQLAAIVEFSEDAIISKDLKGNILTWNKGAEKIYGYYEEEVRGKNIALLTPPQRLQEIIYILEKIKIGEYVKNFETVRLNKRGAKINVSLSISPIKDESGRIIAASTIARDITEEKKLEDELKKKIFDLERFQKVTVDRELKMKELKQEIVKLKAKLNEVLSPDSMPEDKKIII